jgi:hypothetical protein
LDRWRRFGRLQEHGAVLVSDKEHLPEVEGSQAITPECITTRSTLPTTLGGCQKSDYG